MASIRRSQTGEYVYLTSEGLSGVQDELHSLKKTKRAEITKRLEHAREMGDLAENAEYDAALEEQSLVENRISYLEKILRDAQVIKHDTKDTDIVTIGSTVTVEMDGKIDEFTIVGRVEANPAKKRISNESPVGTALLGARAGEEVEVTTPIVRYKCKILEIR